MPLISTGAETRRSAGEPELGRDHRPGRRQHAAEDRPQRVRKCGTRAERDDARYQDRMDFHEITWLL